MEGADEIFAALRHRGIKVALDTGFSRPTVEVIFARLGWSVPSTFDAVVTSDELLLDAVAIIDEALSAR